MKFLLLLCLVVGSRASFFDSIGHALSSAAHTVGDGVVDAAHTVGDGVVDAANTVGDGVETAAHAVGNVLPDVASTLGSTFGDIWNVAKDPLEEAGKELLKEAAAYALQQGVTMALDALAAGKREVPDRDQMKALMYMTLVDETKKWMEETKQQVLGSKDELIKSMSRFQFHDMPEELKSYVANYAQAKTLGKTNEFIAAQAQSAYQTAVSSLKQRLTQRLQTFIQSLTASV